MRSTRFGVLLVACLLVTAACDDEVMGTGAVASVEIAPDSSAIPVERTVQLTATTRNMEGNVLTGRTVIWSSTDESIATVDAAGLVTGIRAGAVSITATSEGVNGTAPVTVLETFTATLLGANEVPSLMSNDTGSATVIIDGNLLTYKVDVTNIDDVVAAHIHSGAVGSTGPIIVDFGITGQAGNFTGTQVDDTMTVDDATLADIRSGNAGAYVNVPTALNQLGEIRGQLFPLAQETFTATLDGASQVPSVMTNATGTATHTVRRMLLSYRIDVADIDSVTAAHIHSGAGGVVGNIIVGLFGGPTTDLMFTGTLVDSTTTITDAVLLELRSGDTYTNVHTKMHVPGEIRGQNVPQ